MRPLRRLMAVLEPSVYDRNIAAYSDSNDANTSDMAGGSASNMVMSGASPDSLDPSALAATVQLGPVSAADVTAALAVTKPSAQAFEQQYRDFSNKYGQTL